MPPYPTKITIGELRASGVRDVLIYCRDYRCSHHIESGRSFRRPEWGPVETCALVHQICPRPRFAAIRQ